MYEVSLQSFVALKVENQLKLNRTINTNLQYHEVGEVQRLNALTDIMMKVLKKNKKTLLLSFIIKGQTSPPTNRNSFDKEKVERFDEKILAVTGK